MNLTKAFPEIDEFFRLDSFDYDELGKFIDNLRATYKGGLLKKALAFVELQLVGYQLKNLEHPSKISASEKSPLKAPAVEEESWRPEIESSLEELAIQLQWSVYHLQRLVEQKTGVKQATTLTKNEYAKCAEAIFSRKKALARQLKAERFALDNFTKKHPRLSNNSRRQKNSKASSGVWGEVAKHGAGKLIYIRSK